MRIAACNYSVDEPQYLQHIFGCVQKCFVKMQIFELSSLGLDLITCSIDHNIEIRFIQARDAWIA